jgi:hypothetical protein
MGIYFEPQNIRPDSPYRPFPGLPTDTDDVHIQEDEVNPPAGAATAMTGFLASRAIFATMDPILETTLSSTGLEGRPWSEQRSLISTALTAVKAVMATLPAELARRDAKVRPRELRSCFKGGTLRPRCSLSSPFSGRGVTVSTVLRRSRRTAAVD